MGKSHRGIEAGGAECECGCIQAGGAECECGCIQAGVRSKSVGKSQIWLASSVVLSASRKGVMIPVE